MAKRRRSAPNYYVPEQATKRRRKFHKKKTGCFKYFVIGGVALLFVAVLLTPSANSNISPSPTPTPEGAQTLSFFAQEPVETPAPTATPAPHIYDNAEIRDVHNGLGTEVIGQFSLIHVPYSECTDEALADWYFNHVSINDFNWCMILYSDRSDNSGVYSISGLVQKDVTFEPDNFNQYMLGNTSNSILYAPSDGTLKKMKGF